MSVSTFTAPFSIRDKVIIDGCPTLIGWVTAVLWREERPLIEVSWVDGQARTAWFEIWRLEIAGL
jgi:hypothetical protein